MQCTQIRDMTTAMAMTRGATDVACGLPTTATPPLELLTSVGGLTRRRWRISLVIGLEAGP